MPLVEADPSKDFLCSYRDHCLSLCHCCQFDACDCHVACPVGCRSALFNLIDVNLHYESFSASLIPLKIISPPDNLPMLFRCFRDEAWAVNVVDCSGNGNSGRRIGDIPMDATEVSKCSIESIPLPNPSCYNAHMQPQPDFKVVLAGNRLPVLSKRIFMGRRAVQRLFLNNTALEVIAEEALDSMETLDTLHLESNLLESLREDTFKYQRSLKRLYLHHNRLKSLGWDSKCV